MASMSAKDIEDMEEQEHVEETFQVWEWNQLSVDARRFNACVHNLAYEVFGRVNEKAKKFSARFIYELQKERPHLAPFPKPDQLQEAVEECKQQFQQSMNHEKKQNASG